MSESTDPLLLEYGVELNGLLIVRQAPPAGAASFSATYVGPAGYGFDPAGGEGTARLVCQLVTSAAGRLGRVALARRLDRAGATLSRECAPESAEVTIWGPAGDWADLIGLLADVVLRPRFDLDDLNRARRQFLERQLRESTQPAARAERELLRLIFPEGHPYRATGLGDRRSVERLTRADLVRFHARHYTSGEGLLVVTAPAHLAEIEQVARRRFSEFAEIRGPTLRIPAVRPRPSTVKKIDLPGRSQVEVRVGGTSLERTHPSYPAAFLANEVLGGRPLLGRLFQRVRERGGLAYHASSALDSMRFGGYWVAEAGTGGDRWPRVVPMLEEEIERLRTETVRPSELEEIRESAIGELPLSLESTADAHDLAVDAAYNRLPPDHWIRWPTELRAVRPRELREAAGLAFDRRSAATVLAGPLSGK